MPKKRKRVKKEKKGIVEKEVSFFKFTWKTHIIIYLAGLLILAFVFDAINPLITYIVLVFIFLLFGYFLYKHNHKIYPEINILGLYFFPMLIVRQIFHDVYSHLMLIIFCIALVGTIVSYYRYKKKHSFTSIMWRMVYSQTGVVAVATLVILILPRLFLRTKFVSMPTLIVLFILPFTAIYFFKSKFLYDMFFKEKTVKENVYDSLKFAVTIGLVFVAVFALIYTCFGFYLYYQKSTVYENEVQNLLVEVRDRNLNFEKKSAEFLNLEVIREIRKQSVSFEKELGKSKIVVLPFLRTVNLVLTDDYFRILIDYSIDLVQKSQKANNLFSIKDRAVKNYDEMKKKEIKEVALINKKRKIIDNYFNKQKASLRFFDPMLTKIRTLRFNFNDMLGFENTIGLESTILKDIVVHKANIIERTYSFTYKHTKLYKNLFRMAIEFLYSMNKQKVIPESILMLYENIDIDESPESKSLRYDILYSFVLEQRESLQKI